MLHMQKFDDRRGIPQERYARTVPCSSLSELIIKACARPPAPNPPGRAHIDQLIAAGAWTDAALALIELELPKWTLRRLAYDEGEWHCSLTKHCAIPAEFDDSADGTDELLPLALMSAFLEARRLSAPAVRPRTVPSVGPR
jgi:hypothetical protein